MSYLIAPDGKIAGKKLLGADLRKKILDLLEKR